MKIFSRMITVVLAGCGAATAQEPAKGRIYIGDAQAAPAWVEQMPKPSTLTNQMTANATFAQSADAVVEQQRSDAKNAILKAEAARAAFQADPRYRTLLPTSAGPQFARERGVIVDYDTRAQLGLISGEDGRRWPFRGAEWYARGVAPASGTWVDFVPESETGFALFIYSLGPFNASHLEVDNSR